MAVVNGNDLEIVTNGVIIPSQTRVTLETSRDLILVTTRQTDGFRERIPGNRDATLSFEGFYDNEDDRLEPGTFVTWRFRSLSGTFHGEGYITSEGYVAGTDSAPTRAGTIEVTGEFNFSEQLLETLQINGVTVCVETEELQALV